MEKKYLLQEIINDFRKSALPEFIPRQIDFSVPPNKVRSVIGARRSGKTYSLYQLVRQKLDEGIDIERILYINFEDERLLPFTVDDLTLAIDTFYSITPHNKRVKCFLFFDEIQNISGWEIFIRRVFDRENVEITLSGSSSKLLSKELSTSMRGRAFSINVYPFSFKEYLMFLKIDYQTPGSENRAFIINAFQAYLMKGGLPETLNLDENFRIRVMQDYFNLLLYKDLVERYDLRNHFLIKYILKFLLQNCSNPLSITKFYNDSRSQGLNFSKDSLFQYISLIEDAFWFSFIPVFSESIRKQQTNYKKIYALDSGLVTALSPISKINRGRLLENIVYNQLRRSRPGASIHYYKTTSGKEIDFLVVYHGKIDAVWQVCESLQEKITKEREINALMEAMEELNINSAGIITAYESDNIQNENRRIEIVPFWRWALEEG